MYQVLNIIGVYNSSQIAEDETYTAAARTEIK